MLTVSKSLGQGNLNFAWQAHYAMLSQQPIANEHNELSPASVDAIFAVQKPLDWDDIMVYLFPPSSPNWAYEEEFERTY
jgi:hypothetical protein